jgi:hypothetical protein
MGEDWAPENISIEYERHNMTSLTRRNEPGDVFNRVVDQTYILRIIGLYGVSYTLTNKTMLNGLGNVNKLKK